MLTFRSLEADRIISIYFSDKTKPVRLQQCLLESVSEYFVKALRNEHLGSTGEAGILRFPEDRVDTWNVFLYWLLKREMPKDVLKVNDLLAVRCWVLGDKYDIPVFQNLAMVALIRKYDNESPSLEVIKEAVSNTRQGSVLRRIMAEECVVRLQRLEPDALSPNDMDQLDGYGFMRDFFEAQLSDVDDYRGISGHGDRIECFSTPNDYMVGDGISPDP